MSDRTDTLAQVLFNKPSLQECSLQQVEYLAHQYPYFSTAQLLLLQKTEPSSVAYTQQLQRTALYFSNPLPLQIWLESDALTATQRETELFQNPISEPIELAPEKVLEISAAEVAPEQIAEKDSKSIETAEQEIAKAPSSNPNELTEATVPERVEAAINKSAESNTVAE